MPGDSSWTKATLTIVLRWMRPRREHGRCGDHERQNGGGNHFSNHAQLHSQPPDRSMAGGASWNGMLSDERSDSGDQRRKTGNGSIIPGAGGM